MVIFLLCWIKERKKKKKYFHVLSVLSSSSTSQEEKAKCHLKLKQFYNSFCQLKLLWAPLTLDRAFLKSCFLSRPGTLMALKEQYHLLVDRTWSDPRYPMTLTFLLLTSHSCYHQSTYFPFKFIQLSVNLKF